MLLADYDTIILRAGMPPDDERWWLAVKLAHYEHGDTRCTPALHSRAEDVAAQRLGEWQNRCPA